MLRRVVVSNIVRIPREMLVTIALLGCTAAIVSARSDEITTGNRPIELNITEAGAQSIQITLRPLKTSGPPASIRSLSEPRTLHVSRYEVKVSNNPLRVQVLRRNGSLVQDLRFESVTGSVSFALGGGPLFGLGEGGPQFNRRGNHFSMLSSQDAYNKPYFGGRMPVPWLMGDGWALFLHSPEGAIDLGGSRGRFTPFPSEPPLPMEIFVTSFKEPVEALTEYARLTGFPSMPPIWALGYEQSHRTVKSREALFTIARNFREKHLPCDVLIYLGTGWAPSGWNTGHRSFEFNKNVFPHPAEDIRDLHEMHFKVVLHEMGPPTGLFGRVSDVPKNSDPNEVANYWKLHVPVEKLGVDGWWPDEGEHLSPASRMARIRMYWEGPQLQRPDVRPFSLNRAGYAGMQRYGGWLWSGDLNSTWRTLAHQVQVGINTALSGVPYWGTEIGGFFSTKELTGELFARWFEFGTFCPVFRAHGRPSATRYPWSWNTGEIGAPELSPEVAGSAPPDLEELHNPAVEPICRKYLDLRYRMLPYIYSAAREAHETGVPIMRALWLYYSDDPKAAARGDEFLWGRDILVAPVTEKSATSRTFYLPRGNWYDFWSSKRVEGGKEITRPVDLATVLLYVRAGAILPLGPVKQYTTEKVKGALVVTIYPGANGHFVLYDDDGVSFDFRKGEFNRVDFSWNDRTRRLTIQPRNAKMWNVLTRDIEVRLATTGETKHLVFDGEAHELQF